MKKVRLHPFITQNKIAFLSLGLIFSSLVVGSSLSGANPAIYKITGDEDMGKTASTTVSKTTTETSTAKSIVTAGQDSAAKTAAKATDTTAKSVVTAGQNSATRTAAKKTEVNQTNSAACIQTCVNKGRTPYDCAVNECGVNAVRPSPSPKPSPIPPSYWGGFLPNDISNISPDSRCDPRLPDTCGEGRACTALARPLKANGQLLHPDEPVVYACDTHPNVNNRNCELMTDETGNYVSIQEGSILGDGGTTCERSYDPVLGYEVNSGYAYTQDICANGSIFKVEKTKTYNANACPPGNTNDPRNFVTLQGDSPACGSIVLGQGNDTGVTDFKNQQCCKYVNVNSQSPDGIPYKNMCTGLENVPDTIYDLFHNEVGTFGFPELGISEFVGGVINDIFK